MTINGIPEPHEPVTLLQYLEQKGYNTQRIVVERNMEIITRERFGEVTLQPEDEINILHFMGGG